MVDAGKGEARSASASTAADALLASLHRHGFAYFFANPGTDFPPIIEAFARAKAGGNGVPQPVLVPHENLAVAMACLLYTSPSPRD